MKRDDFKKIIKLRSFWRVDKRKGNYRLPNGTRLSDYLIGLVESQLKIDMLGIAKDGSIQPMVNQGDDLVIMKPFAENEATNDDEQDTRIERLVYEFLN